MPRIDADHAGANARSRRRKHGSRNVLLGADTHVLGAMEALLGADAIVLAMKATWRCNRRRGWGGGDAGCRALTHTHVHTHIPSLGLPHFRYMSTVQPYFLLETLASTLDTTVTLF